METFGLLISPPVLAGILIWNFAVLSAVQLTVRLIGAYAFWPTVRAALLLTLSVLAVAVLHLFLAQQITDDGVLSAMRQRGAAYAQTYVFQQRLLMFPLAIVFVGLAGFAIIRRALRFKRTLSAVIAAIGIGLLSAPWLVFVDLPT